MVQIDRKTLFVETDGDVFEVDVNGDIARLLQSRQRGQGLKHHKVLQALPFQHIFYAPHANSRASGGLDLTQQGHQVLTVGDQNDFIESIAVGARQQRKQFCGQKVARSLRQNCVTGIAKNAGNARSLAIGGASVRLHDGERAQLVRTHEPGDEGCVAFQPHRQFLQIYGDAPPLQALLQVLYVNYQKSGHFFPKKNEGPFAAAPGAVPISNPLQQLFALHPFASDCAKYNKGRHF